MAATQAIFGSVLPLAATVIVIIALIFSYSRGAWIAFLGSMIAIGIMARPGGRRTNS